MKRVLLRVDFNVPLKNGRVADDFRIKAALPTIKKIVAAGKQIFLITHLEQDGKNPNLDTIKTSLEKLIGGKIGFVQSKLPTTPQKFAERVILLDNIRLNQGEIKNDSKFARTLASWGDEYINEAFSASHRCHASIVSIPKYLPSSLGPLFKRETENLSKFFKPRHHFILILGGKKFSTKEPLICKFLESADVIFVGGALGNAFLKQRGFDIGKSKVDDEKIPKEILWSPKIILPEDAIVIRKGKRKTVWMSGVENADLIYDAGPKTVGVLSGITKNAGSILWNGTLGLCEEGFDYGTRELGRALGASKAFKVVGGGDTVAAIRQMKLEKNFDFLSTGGGAMLEFLATGTLPGIEAIKKH